jgi:hypothetical protein
VIHHLVIESAKINGLNDNHIINLGNQIFLDIYQAVIVLCTPEEVLSNLASLLRDDVF